MPDIREALEWKNLGDAKRIASETGRLIFIVVAAPWSTGAHVASGDLADPQIQAQLEADFVPVHLDPVTDLVETAQLSLLARYQGASGALPLVGVLTPGGNPALAIPYPQPGHRSPDTPSLGAWLQAVAEKWKQDPAPFNTEWQGASIDLAQLNAIQKNDPGAGEKQESPRNLPVWDLASAASSAPDDAWLQATLNQVWTKGVRDQLEPSFHPGTRGDNWVIPWFEKILPQNAAMAFSYASVAKQTGDRAVRSQAQDLVRYSLNAFLQASDVVSADSQYYTWLSTEVFDAVSRQNLQALSFIFGIQPNERRQVLSEARPLEDIAGMSYEPLEAHQARVLSGRAELLMHRRTRPAPRPLAFSNPAWRAESYRWLAMAMERLESADASLLNSAFVTWLAGVEPELAQANVTVPAEFQGQVSLLAGIYRARKVLRDPVIESALDVVRENTRQGIIHWNQVVDADRLWLSLDGYLPSVRSVLTSVQEYEHVSGEETLPDLV